ncbi:MAG: hypothetical protein ACRDVG_04840 [Jatrophihabitantaceae bacterium]
MAGRSPDMDAMPTAVAVRRELPYRGICVVAGLLCVLGVLSGTLLRANGATHHHHPAVTAAASVADGHGVNARGDQHAVLVQPAAEHDAVGEIAFVRSPHALPDLRSVETVRTRGPPAAA